MINTLFKQILLVMVLAAVGCQPANNSIFNGNSELVQLESDYTAAPSAVSGSALIKKLSEVINAGGLTDATKKQYLEYGLDIARSQKIPSKVAGFLFPLIRNDENSATRPDQLFELAGILGKLKKEAAANTLYKGLVDNYPSYSQIEQAKSMITTPIDSIHSYILDLGQKLFEDDNGAQINRRAAMQYVDACEAYALAYPSAVDAPDNLFKAAEVAKSIRTFPKSLTLYDWILEKYPTYHKTPTSLFLKGFIIENELKDDKKAREIYDSFLAKYPTHDLADDVEFLIENLGKTDEEILQMIEEKRKQREQNPS